jgi:hypothetical protein
LEVFSFGAWKHMGELEDSLILAELFELYQNAIEREARMQKVMAAAMGADVSGSEGGSGEYSSSGVPLTSDAAVKDTAGDGGDLPPGVGYTKL